MSHLSTLINRVEAGLARADGNEQDAAKDPLFRQAVLNLREYQEAWDDFTPDERQRADTLYARFAHLIRRA